MVQARRGNDPGRTNGQDHIWDVFKSAKNGSAKIPIPLIIPLPYLKFQCECEYYIWIPVFLLLSFSKDFFVLFRKLHVPPQATWGGVLRWCVERWCSLPGDPPLLILQTPCLLLGTPVEVGDCEKGGLLSMQSFYWSRWEVPQLCFRQILGVHFRGLGYILFGSTFRVLWDLEKVSHDILVVGVCIEMNQEYRISLGRISPSDCTTFD